MPPKTAYLLDDQAPKAELWNAHFRWSGKDAANFLAAHAYNQLSGVSAGTARVIGGLTVTAGSGMQSDYTAGAAIHHDASVYTAVLAGEDTVSPFGWQMVEAAGSLTHDAAHATLTRVDLLCILSTIGTDRSESVQQDGGSTTPQNTRWGAQSSVVIVKGTAGSGVPGTPTGYTKLAEASIPALAVAASSFTYTDSRTIASNNLLRNEIYAVTTTDGGDVGLVRADADGGDGLILQWDKDDHWPMFWRTNPPAGDTADTLWPMVVPASRSWTRSYPLRHMSEYVASGVGINADVSSGASLLIARTGIGSNLYQLSVPVEARGLEVTSIKLRWETPTAWDATVDTASWALSLFDVSAGSAVAITGSETLDITTAYATIQAGVATIAATPVVEDGDYLSLVVQLTTSGAGVAGVLELHSVEVTFKEGRV